MAPRKNEKTSELKGENGKKPKSLIEGINEKVNADEKKVEEIEKNKSKRGKIAELTKKLEEAAKRAEEADKRAKEAEEQVQQQQVRIKDLEKYSAQRDKDLADAEEFNKILQGEGNQKAEGIRILNDNLMTSQNRIKELEDANKVYMDGAKSLVKRQKALREENDNLQKQYNDITEGVRKSTLKSPEEVDQARKELESLESKAEEVKTANSDEGSSSRDVGAEWLEMAKALNEGRLSDAKKLADQTAKKYGYTSEPKVDNSAKTEETVAPETGEAKVEGEPKAKTEQATQEPKSEAKQPSTESSEMTPEEAYEYLSNKKNFKEANTYFLSGKDSYIGTNGKHLPKSWFDVFNENKTSDHSIQPFLFNSNNKDVFTASLREKGLLEDPKKEPSREDTVKTLAEAGAKAKFDDWIASKGNKFRGIFGKHKVLYSTLLLGGISPAILKAIDAIGDWGREQAIDDMQVPDKEFWGESEDNNDDYNGEPIEPGNVAEQVANAAQETAQADNTAEEQAAQTLQENLPQGEADATNQSKGESPVATNASTPASTKANKANNAPASTAKPAPTQDTTQGLPPVVVNNTPPANANSSGMTYSQLVEAGQAPQAGSMAYNANPDMVTAGLIDAMNQNPQAGSDAIGYGDLYDQNFIDFWAKRNPNLAYAVSQGRR